MPLSSTGSNKNTLFTVNTIKVHASCVQTCSWAPAGPPAWLKHPMVLCCKAVVLSENDRVKHASHSWPRALEGFNFKNKKERKKTFEFYNLEFKWPDGCYLQVFELFFTRSCLSSWSAEQLSSSEPFFILLTVWMAMYRMLDNLYLDHKEKRFAGGLEAVHSWCGSGSGNIVHSLQGLPHSCLPFPFTPMNPGQLFVDSGQALLSEMCGGALHAGDG